MQERKRGTPGFDDDLARVRRPRRTERDRVKDPAEFATASQAFRRADLGGRNGIASLQRVGGNGATGALIQTKLEVGPAGDRYEVEADRVAKQVMGSLGSAPASGPAPSAQRQEEEELMMKRLPIQRQEEEELMMKRLPIQRQEEEELMAKRLPIQRQEEEELMMKRLPIQRQEEEELMAKRLDVQLAPVVGLEGGPLDTGTEGMITAAKGGGKSLDDGVRRQMEGAFQADFSNVKVHDNSSSHALNDSLQARAFTTGSDIFFRKGDYQPGSRGGQELIAHELTHVVQQGGAPVQRTDEDHAHQH